MFAGIFALRMAVSDPVEPVLFLMVVPISLIGVEFGLIGGTLAAALASILVIVWEVLGAPELSWLGYSTRFLVFFLSGLTVGALTSSRREKEDESQRWFEGSVDLNCVADFEGRLIRVNHAWTTALGYSSQELANVPYVRYVHPDDVDNTTKLSEKLTEGRTQVIDFENRYRTSDGRYRWLRWTATTDMGRRLIYASARDITTTKELEMQLRELAQTDSLTGLSNRRHFEEEASRQIDFIRRYGPAGSLFLFDVDGFKTVNDTLGHQAGDEILKSVALIVKNRIRSTDVCGRIGGDEFAILFPGVRRQEAELLASALVDTIKENSAEVNRSVRCTISIGVVTFYPSDVSTVEELLAVADAAMYEAKRAGGDRYALRGAAQPSPG
jgi:diguanylate cyclase (GGDEF)-like protein/PAS domain S-box-containing protein